MNQIIAFALTEMIELCIALSWWRLTDRPHRFSRMLLMVITASALTHPWAWMLNDSLRGTLFGWERVISIEILVISAEAALYRYLLPSHWRWAISLSILTNLSSLVIGLWLLDRL